MIFKTKIINDSQVHSYFKKHSMKWETYHNHFFLLLHINENAFKQDSFSDVVQRANVGILRLVDETYISNIRMQISSFISRQNRFVSKVQI